MLIMNGRERISSKGDLLAACFLPMACKLFAVLDEQCLDSQVYCHFPGISLLVVTMLLVVLAKNRGTDSLNYPCSLNSCFKSFLCWEASWGGKQELQIVLKYWFWPPLWNSCKSYISQLFSEFTPRSNSSLLSPTHWKKGPLHWTGIGGRQMEK